MGGVEAPGVGGTGGLAVTPGLGQGAALAMVGGLVTLPALGLRDDPLGDLNPAEIRERLLDDFDQRKGSFAKRFSPRLAKLTKDNINWIRCILAHCKNILKIALSPFQRDIKKFLYCVSLWRASK